MACAFRAALTVLRRAGVEGRFFPVFDARKASASGTSSLALPHDRRGFSIPWNVACVPTTGP